VSERWIAIDQARCRNCHVELFALYSRGQATGSVARVAKQREIEALHYVDARIISRAGERQVRDIGIGTAGFSWI
jgi:hypothetical protein